MRTRSVFLPALRGKKDNGNLMPPVVAADDVLRGFSSIQYYFDRLDEKRMGTGRREVLKLIYI